ncbi:MAG: hypothetical protein AB7S26_21960 [Sandaracinaceae bacterium]
MGYRDETEQLRAKVTQLEAELADARGRVDRLTGLAPASDDPGLTTTPSRILAGPKTLRTVRELDYELSDEGFVAIARLFEQRRPAARVTQVGGQLTAPGLDVRRGDGKTTIAVSTTLAAIAALPISIGGVLGPFLSLVTFAIAHDFVFRTMSEAHLFWMLPIAVTLAFLSGVRIARGRAKTVVAQHHALAEAIAEVASRHRPPAAKVRVDTSFEERPASSSAELTLEEGLGAPIAQESAATE